MLGAALLVTVGRARAAGGEAAAFGSALDASWIRLVAVTRCIQCRARPGSARHQRGRLSGRGGHLVGAWIWLAQYPACADADTGFHWGERAAARYFFRYVLPKTGPQLDLLAALDRTTVDLDSSIL